MVWRGGEDTLVRTIESDSLWAEGERESCEMRFQSRLSERPSSSKKLKETPTECNRLKPRSRLLSGLKMPLAFSFLLLIFSPQDLLSRFVSLFPLLSIFSPPLFPLPILYSLFPLHPRFYHAHNSFYIFFEPSCLTAIPYVVAKT